MITVALGGLLVSWLRGRLAGRRNWWIPFAMITAAVLLLQFPFSRPLWNLLPELRFLQFPWRWLVVLEAPMAIFFAAAIWPDNSARLWRRVAVVAACALLFLAMTSLAGLVFFQSCYPEDAVPGMLDTYRAGQGFGGTDEYEPIGADNSLVATGLPVSCLVSDPATVLGKGGNNDDIQPAWDAGQGSCESTFAAVPTRPSAIPAPANCRCRSSCGLPDSSVAHLSRVARKGQRPTRRICARRDDGLMVVSVPQGPVDVTIDWTTTADIIAGRWLSGLALLFVTALCVLEKGWDRTRLS